MKKRIIICLNPFESHFYPTIAFAKHMEELNFSVIYMGFDSLKQTVLDSGFPYLSLKSSTNDRIEELRKEKEYRTLETVYKNLHKEAEETLAQCCPDIVLIGISRQNLYLIPALNCNAKIFLYSLCGGIPYFNNLSPPITSDFIYQSKTYQQMVNAFLWIKRLLIKGVNSSVLYERHFYPWNNMRSLCKKRKIKWRFGIDGFFADFPILVFGSRYLEFGKINSPIYLGLGVLDHSGKNSLKESAFLKSSTPLIYCTLGTMNNRYKMAPAFFSAIINLFREMPQWTLVLSVGKYIRVDMNQLPENVYVYEFAPQMSILKMADLVITHGGYGTVKECIKNGVPMLVFPCVYDQRGNAARIQFHEIGVRDSLLDNYLNKKNDAQEISPQHIRLLIEKVLYNPIYKSNIRKLQLDIENANELVEACKKIKNSMER